MAIEWKKQEGVDNAFTAHAGEYGDIEINANEHALTIECGELFIECGTYRLERSKALAEAWLPHVLAMASVKTSDLEKIEREATRG